MKTVFRYEHIKTKKGPYNAGWYYAEKLVDNHTDKIKTPCMRKDLGSFKDGYLSACKSISELRNWFKGYNSKILNSDFVLVKYTLKSYFETKSGKQVAFDPKNIIHREVIN